MHFPDGATAHVSQNNKDTIYRISDDSDLFACTECKVRSDKWAMQAYSYGTKKNTDLVQMQHQLPL
jgi:hypothetical protein